ncbi:MAG: orotidine-5'-phosphate decarboxylase, partial [Candidatus Nanohaloarchaea archaeon]
FGIDVRPEYDRAIGDPLSMDDDGLVEAAATMRDFAIEKIDEMADRDVFPAGFKFNRGSWAQLDGPGGLHGQQALRDVMREVRERTDSFLILDAKDGDIGPTARAYAVATFNAWPADAVTAHTEMGSDSFGEFIDVAARTGGCVFCLVRTSNPSAAETQDLYTLHPDRLAAEVEAGMDRYYERMAATIADHADGDGTVGAVVGATTLGELADIVAIFQDRGVEPPLLLPGVGDQGADAADVVDRVVDRQGYPRDRVFINSSSGQTYRAAKDGQPRETHAAASVDELERLIEVTR